MPTPPHRGTPYHASVADFRRALVTSAEIFGDQADRYSARIYAADPGRAATPTERDAYTAAWSAHNYGYTLAAILKMAAEKFGDAAAHTLACEADEMLTNGDYHGWNDDVQPPPTGTEPDPLPVPAPGPGEAPGGHRG